MPTPTVSVIIPTYNYRRFIADAINSVLNQTFGDYEIIVVDDGSDDGTEDTVRQFGTNVRFLYQRNAGAAAARNTGIRMSQGTYIAFLDADDTWLAEKLERQVSVLASRPDIDVVYTWWKFIDSHGRPFPQVKSPRYEGDVLHELLFGCFVTFSMLMLRRECFERIGLLDERLAIAEDWDLLLRLALGGHRFAVVPEVLVTNRLHEMHLSGSLARKLECERAVLSKALTALPSGEDMERLGRRAMRMVIVGSALEFYAAGNANDAVGLLREAVELQPQDLERPGFFVGMANKLVPYGERGAAGLCRRLEEITGALQEMLRGLFAGGDLSGEVRRRQRVAWSNLMLASAVLNARCRRWGSAAGFLGRSIGIHPINLWMVALARVRLSRASGPDGREALEH